MKILVYGAGAVGQLLGGLLAQSGHSVSLLGRDYLIKPLQERKLSILGLWGNFEIRLTSLYTELSHLVKTAEPWDLILLTVKAYDSASALKSLKPLMKPSTHLLCFQNGLTQWDEIKSVLDERRCLLGRIITGVEIAPAQITVTVSAGDLVIGAWDRSNAALEHKARDWVRLFRDAQIPCQFTEGIQTEIWMKAIYNCALNAPATLIRSSYGQLLETHESRERLKRIVEECFAVAKAKRIELVPSQASDYFELLTHKLIPITAEHYPSMLRDIEKNRPTEIDALNGAISRYGRLLGVPTPENDRVTAEIHSLLKRN